MVAAAFEISDFEPSVVKSFHVLQVTQKRYICRATPSEAAIDRAMLCACLPSRKFCHKR
jgi:hypothetical protein